MIKRLDKKLVKSTKVFIPADKTNSLKTIELDQYRVRVTQITSQLYLEFVSHLK